VKTTLERWIRSPYAEWFLTFCAIIEAAIFPISVDVPLIGMGVLQPKRSLYYAFLVSFGSFLGGYIGYAIGFYFFPSLANPLIHFFGLEANVASVLYAYSKHSVLSLALAGFLPIPYITFTFAAGYQNNVGLLPFTLGALIGRFVRFYAVGIPIYYFGENAKRYLKHFQMATIVLFIVLLVVLFAAWRWLP
jgi:membrane protein YqaA with SNARE-associated domain